MIGRDKLQHEEARAASLLLSHLPPNRKGWRKSAIKGLDNPDLAMQFNEPTAFRDRTRKPARYVVIVASERSHTSGR